ncbi:hypothetical protein MTO96_037733 [Rhipicephalus appendiculatus]
MSKESWSSSRQRRDSQMDPQKKNVEEDDSGLGTSKSQTRSSGATSGEVHGPSKAGLSLSTPGPSRDKSPAKKSPAPGRSRTKSPAKKTTAPGRSRTKSPAKKTTAPGAPHKSPLKKVVGLLFGSSSPKPPTLGASPSNLNDWSPSSTSSKTAPRSSKVLPPELLEQEGIRTRAPLASVEDLTSPTSERPDSPIPSTSIETKARISDPPPPDRSPTPPPRRYPTSEAAKKKGP